MFKPESNLAIKRIVAATIVLIVGSAIGSANCFARAAKATAPAKEATTWQEDEQIAAHSETEGNYDEAEKRILSALKKLKIEFKDSPATSFANRYFPLRNTLMALYLNRAETQEGSLPFNQIDGFYKKALNMKGAPQEVWHKYVDFLRRNGREKQADQAEKDGKKRCLYWTNQ